MEEDPKMFQEPTIVINGKMLGIGAAMTVRVAVEQFAMVLAHEGLGTDPNGIALTNGYQKQIAAIQEAMYNLAPRPRGSGG